MSPFLLPKHAFHCSTYNTKVRSLTQQQSTSHLFTLLPTGTNYNIPVTIWLRPTHPYSSPIVYVTPTEDMGIQQSRYVDASGLVYLPYLSEWKQVHQCVVCVWCVCVCVWCMCALIKYSQSIFERPWL